MNSRKYVFISYSRHDAPFVDRLSSDLQTAGIQVWRDVMEIQAGTNWQKAIENGLERAKSLIYVSSKHSAESPWMTFELLAYWRKSGTVIPVIIDDDGEKRLPNSLRLIQWVDFRQNYNFALQVLKVALSDMVVLGPEPKAKSKKTKGYVFLSYAEEDSGFIAKLRQFLAKHSYAYWDYEDSDRDYHSQMFLELEGVIREATATLSILSPAWKKSQWAVKEYLFSEEINTPIFLLKVKEIGPALVIAGVPYIDFLRNENRGFNKLARELQRKGL